MARRSLGFVSIFREGLNGSVRHERRACGVAPVAIREISLGPKTR